MKIMDYLTNDVNLSAGDKFRLPGSTEERVLIKHEFLGWAMTRNYHVVTEWCKVNTLSEFNKKIGFNYAPLGNHKYTRYLKPGDVLHYSKYCSRVVIRLSDRQFVLLNPDTLIVHIKINTESTVGITLDDLKRSRYIIDPNIIVEPKVVANE